jgi:hypothetical protein
LENLKTIESEDLDPWSLFIYAMKAPMTKDRYKARVAKFFDFIGLDNEGQTVEEKARVFVDRGKEDLNWAFTNVLKFIHFQKERVNRKEISGATMRNYAEYQAILRYVRHSYSMEENNAWSSKGKKICR